MEVFTRFSEVFERQKIEELSLQDYLLGCRSDQTMRATAAERMVKALGEPRLVDTSQDQRLGRIFLNRTIRRYPAFDEMYGVEETIGTDSRVIETQFGIGCPPLAEDVAEGKAHAGSEIRHHVACRGHHKVFDDRWFKSRPVEKGQRVP